MTPPFFLFTDIDGCILDADTYEWAPALPAIEELKHRGVPTALVTSKTLAETVELHRELNLDGPIVAETGGVFQIDEKTSFAPFSVKTEKLVQHLSHIREQLDAPVRGVTEMSVDEVADWTKLPPEQARVAIQRECTLPFVLDGIRLEEWPSWRQRLSDAAEERELRCIQGGRFFHLLGRHDKGSGVRRILKGFKKEYGGLPSVGIGDSPSDLDLLLETDTPVAVPKSDGKVHPTVLERIPGILTAPLPGPAGWNLVVLQLLKSR